MKYPVLHRTTYRYGEPVSVSLNQCCLRPRDFNFQHCRMHELHIAPEPPPPSTTTPTSSATTTPSSPSAFPTAK